MLAAALPQPLAALLRCAFLLAACAGAVRAQSPAVDADPLVALEARLEAAKFFKDLTLERIDEYAPVHVYVQKLPSTHERYAAQIARFYGPWLQELRRTYEAELFPGRVAGSAPLCLVVLASHGDYVNYYNAWRGTDLHAGSAHFNFELGICVAFEDSHRRAADHLQRRSVLHTAVHALLHADRASREQQFDVLWLGEGLAEWFAYHQGDAPAELGKHPIEPTLARFLADRYQRSAASAALLPPLADLFATNSFQDIRARATTRGVATDRSVPWEDLAWGFCGKAKSVVRHFLAAQDGELATRFRAYVAEILRGEPRPAAIERLLAGIDRAKLEDDLRAAAFRAAGITPTTGAPAATAAAAQPEAAAAAFDPAVFELAAHELESRIAFEVLRGSDGALAAAAAELARIGAETNGAEAALARARTEAARLEAFRAMRDSWLGELARTQGTLKVDVAGERLSGKVAGFSDGRIAFEKPARGRTSLAADEIPALEWARVIGADAAAHGPEWVRFVPYCVAGDERWKRLSSRASGAEFDALAADAVAYYPRALREGAAARTVALLRAGGLPEDAPAARAVLETIAGLLRESTGTDVVEARRGALRSLAERALLTSLTTGDPAELLRGRLTHLGEGRVRIEYDFATTEQLDDWRDAPALLAGWRASFGSRPAPEASWARSGGRGGMTARGAIALRHALELEAPLSLDVEISWIENANLTDFNWELKLGACAGADLGYVVSSWSGPMALTDPASKQNVYAERKDTPTMFLNTPYRARLRHDGAAAWSELNGVEIARLDASSRKRGETFLWLHSDLEVRVHRVTIEGKLAPDATRPMRAEWIAARIAELGFAPEPSEPGTTDSATK